jgi:Protein of unknown function (DUF3568)
MVLTSQEQIFAAITIKRKKRKIMRILMICAAVLTMTLTNGCTLALIGLGVGAGIAGTAYVDGKLTSSIDAKPAQIKAATEAAFKELGIKLVSSTSNSLETKIVGTSAEDKSVTVTAELKESGQSKLGIRVGTFGDQILSEKIHLAIIKRLPKKKK